MKITYDAIKNELKRRRENTKYYNKSFYKDYKNASETLEKLRENGKLAEDRYEIDGIGYFHSYDKIYASDFYNKNSACYCEFLSIAYGAKLI